MCAGLSLHWYADVIDKISKSNVNVGRATSLLRAGIPDSSAAELDGQTAVLRDRLGDVAESLLALPDDAVVRLRAAADRSPAPDVPVTGADGGADALAFWLVSHLDGWPGAARRLAVVTARLIEDSPAIQPESRRRLPLGRGFEALFVERLKHRYALLPDHLDQLLALHRHLDVLLEEPVEGRRLIERDLGHTLGAEGEAWLNVERRVGTLRFVRRNKTHEGHIRWFVRPDADHEFVLDRLGVRGHWLAVGGLPHTDLCRVATAVERVVFTANSGTEAGWQVVAVSDGAPPDVRPLRPNPAVAPVVLPVVDRFHSVPASVTDEPSMTSLRRLVRAALEGQSPLAVSWSMVQWPPDTRSVPHARNHPDITEFVVSSVGSAIRLEACRSDHTRWTVREVACRPADGDLLAFLDCVARTADLAPVRCELSAGATGSVTGAWVQALLDRIGASGKSHIRRIRLVYVPSSIPHQLGGTPRIGLEFLRDRLERTSAVDILTIRPAEFDVRLVELLGADAVGIGVYVHNRAEVADLVSRLRAAGYTGWIVLGGPEVRNIDSLQSELSGWDAIIRGEAEDVLPQVLEALDLFRAGHWNEGLSAARALSGVALRAGSAILLCETAARNRAPEIRVPLPFDWAGDKGRRRLQMNFTRGCPYQCGFCPNHQGRRFRSGHADELWRYTVLAVADDLALPTRFAQRAAEKVQRVLGVAAPPNLRLALHILLRCGPDRQALVDMCATFYSLIDSDVATNTALLHSLVGMDQTLDAQLRSLAVGPVSLWTAKETWLLAKVAVLASRQLWRRTQTNARLVREFVDHAKPPFVIETSEDNTLVNRSTILEYLRRRLHYGLSEDVVFNPGQNTIWDLTDKNGSADLVYINALVERNPFAVALGADGTSNPVMRQNQKPFYGVRELLAVNRALAQRGVQVANNYILLSPETDLLEAVEAFALFLLLPVPWRDYGPAINLRVIKEETTLSHDEGLIFAPHNDEYDVPLRFPEVRQLLERWSLTSLLPSSELELTLWRILENDEQVRAMLPKVVKRWARDFDADPELATVAELIRKCQESGVSLILAMRAAREELRSQFNAV